MSKRAWIMLGTAVPVTALIAILAWASLKSGGQPGGVNTEFGQVAIEIQEARDFNLKPLSGGPPGSGDLSLSRLKGKVVVLDFWASWCTPCQQEAPALAQVYREFKDSEPLGSELEFVGINIWDGRQGALDHIQRYSVTYPNGIDSTGKILIDYGIRGIPEKIFIDRQGMVVKKFAGPISEEVLRAELMALLARGGEVQEPRR